MAPRVESSRNYHHYPNHAMSYFINDEVIKMTTKNQLRFPMFLIALLAFIAAPTRAQSPNTATMIVAVVDQAGAVVKDAKVLVVNTATGAVREAVSGSDGSATIPALSLTGTYTVGVSREGFGAQELKDITLRSGETATLKVKLMVGPEKAEVIVYSAAEGVRADPQIGRRLDGRQIDETPILGRGITTYGDTGTPLPTFGQLAPVGTATNALPAFANVDPPRMFQVQARFTF